MKWIHFFMFVKWINLFVFMKWINLFIYLWKCIHPSIAPDMKERCYFLKWRNVKFSGNSWNRMKKPCALFKLNANVFCILKFCTNAKIAPSSLDMFAVSCSGFWCPGKGREGWIFLRDSSSILLRGSTWTGNRRHVFAITIPIFAANETFFHLSIQGILRSLPCWSCGYWA